jgi:hypothetical protein
MTVATGGLARVEIIASTGLTLSLGKVHPIWSATLLMSELLV